MSDTINRILARHEFDGDLQPANLSPEDLNTMMKFLEDNYPTNGNPNTNANFYPPPTPQQTFLPPQSPYSAFGQMTPMTPSSVPATPPSPFISTPSNGMIATNQFNTTVATPYGFQTPSTPLTPSAFSTNTPLFYQQSSNNFQENSSVPNTPLTPLSPQQNSTFKEPNKTQVPQPTSHYSEASTQLLTKIQAAHLSQQDLLQQILGMQKQVLTQPTNENFQYLSSQHEQLKKQIDAELQSLTELQKANVLAPHEIRKAFYLQQQLQAQNMQLELYHQELQQLRFQQHGMPPRVFVALVIVEQPLPLILTRGKALEDPVIVRLLTGANVNLQSVSKVKVNLIMDNPQVKGSSVKTIESETESLDELTRSAKFHLKFLSGTRMLLATVKFAVQVQLPGSMPVTLESNASNPFVVITNECQYEEADGLSMRTDIFGANGETVAPWPYFANKLQRTFLRGTRQDPLKPQRFLAKTEIQYLNLKFFTGRPNITAKTFDEFWQWFGKCLQRIRYQRHLCSMWQAGLIYGFVSREQVNAALVNQEPGTFLIRFSERHPGTFAVGYVINETDPEQRVRHYLLKPEDVYAKKTLPDFLMECPQFVKFLQITYELTTGLPKHRIIDKELVLEPYGASAKKNNMESVNGYDPSLVGQQNGSGSMNEDDFM